jgi:hypothetical protein
MIKSLHNLLIGLALLLSTGIANASISLNISPLTQTNSTVDISIVISGLGLGSAPSISAYDLDLHFDVSHLAFASAELGDQLDILHLGENSTYTGITSPGVLNLFELSFDSLNDLNSFQPDSFTLAVIKFNRVDLGSSQIDLVINALGDADGNTLLADVSSATISAVPIPSAILMMFTGVFALFGTTKNRNFFNKR